MSLRLVVALLICAGSAVSLPAGASHLVTGNGFGFAVVAPENGTVAKFYAHPYSFLRPDPKNALSEGIETTNYIKSIGRSGSCQPTSADYVDDSHVIRLKCGASETLVFMPFGLKRAALVVVAGKGAAPLHVDWGLMASSSRQLRAAGAAAKLVTFEGAPEPMLMIALGEPRAPDTTEGLEGSSAWALVALENESQ